MFLTIFWQCFLMFFHFSMLYYVLLRCPFCSIEHVPDSKYMASWPLHVLVVAHGYMSSMLTRWVILGDVMVMLGNGMEMVCHWIFTHSLAISGMILHLFVCILFVIFMSYFLMLTIYSELFTYIIYSIYIPHMLSICSPSFFVFQFCSMHAIGCIKIALYLYSAVTSL